VNLGTTPLSLKSETIEKALSRAFFSLSALLVIFNDLMPPFLASETWSNSCAITAKIKASFALLAKSEPIVISESTPCNLACIPDNTGTPAA
jgi:hypothetical protein